jgi:hypothetical protein
MTSIPTHRVTKVLSAGDFSYQVNDLVDASEWATLHSLVSTDYLVPLSKAEIEALTPVVETPVKAEAKTIADELDIAVSPKTPTKKGLAPKTK